MSAHTPGPWRVGYSDETESEALDYDAIVIVRESNKLIPDEVAEVPLPFLAEMPEDGSTPHDRALADARLIASAPDLAAALAPFARLFATAWVGTMWEGEGDDAAVFYHHETGTRVTLGDFRLAAAVLAKATGVDR